MMSITSLLACILQFGDMLIMTLIQSLWDKNMQDNPAKETVATLTLILAMKYCADDKYNYKLTAEKQQFICERLRVHPLEDQKTCVELQFIEKHYAGYRYVSNMV